MKLFKNTKTFILKVFCSLHKMIQISGFISLIFAFTVSFCYHSVYNRKKKYFSKFAKIRFLTKPNETKFALVFWDFDCLFRLSDNFSYFSVHHFTEQLRMATLRLYGIWKSTALTFIWGIAMGYSFSVVLLVTLKSLSIWSNSERLPYSEVKKLFFLMFFFFILGNYF